MGFLNKRGSWEDFFMYLLLSLFLAAFFVFAVFSKVNAAVNDSSYFKTFYSRDLALLVDSLHAANGEFSVNYDLNTRKKMNLDADLASDKVILTDDADKPVDERPQTSYVFGRSAYVEIIPAAIHGDTLAFSVVGNTSRLTFRFP